MVDGIDVFREHFAVHQHQYVLIGGAACDLLMGEAGLGFRGTKDLDVVLIVEALDADFGKTFWEFIKAGGYEVAQRAETKTTTFYRFIDPTREGYPAMLELFSRSPEGITVDEGHLTPLPVSDEVSSLSAILLDGDYYALMSDLTEEVDGIPLLGPAGLIPFKIRAWVDLSRRKERGEDIKSKDVKKHRNDVARLLQLISPEAQYQLSEKIGNDVRTFANAMEADDTYDPVTFDVPMTREIVAERLRQAYRL